MGINYLSEIGAKVNPPHNENVLLPLLLLVFLLFAFDGCFNAYKAVWLMNYRRVRNRVNGREGDKRSAGS